MTYSSWKLKRDEKILDEIEKIGKYLGLSDKIIEDAKKIYFKIVEKDFLRKIHSNLCPTVVIYAAAVQNKRPLSWRDLGDTTQIPIKNIARAYRKLRRFVLEKKPHLTARDWIPYLVKKLELSEEVEKKALALEEISRSKITGKAEGIASACVYAASMLAGERRTQKEIISVARISEVTIRNRFQELKHIIDFELY